MRRLLLGSFLAVFSAVGALRAAAPGPDAFAGGNALYAEGKFAAAAAAYESQVRRGDVTANLFYNLGDAYYRAGDRGRAILDYQRALVLEPTHPEASANLAFVRGRSAAPSDGGGGFSRWLDVDAWAWLAAAGGWLAVIGGVASVFRARSRGATLPAGLAGAVVCGVASWALFQLEGGSKNPARAVVLADETRALYSPADNSKAVVTLPAGSEVFVLSEQGAWDYVRIGDGSRGWVSADRLEKVAPPARRG